MRAHDKYGKFFQMKLLALPQGLLIALCLYVLGSVAMTWPYPNEMVRPLLPARAAWPDAQVRQFVETQEINPEFLEFFNRDPERVPPPGNAPVSPADGRLKYVIAKDGITYFVIGLSFWDVHVVRSPIAGIVKAIDYKGLSVFRDESETHDLIFLSEKAAPVQAIVTLATAQGDIRVRLITSWWASRLKLRVHVGQQVQRGQRLGRILLGSSVTVDVPGDARFLGFGKTHHLVAGETTIASKADFR